MFEIEKVKANRRRSKILSYLKKQNIMLAEDVKTYIVKNKIEGESRDFAISLLHSLSRCSNLSLYGETAGNIRLISSLTCNHKLCNICNWNRQKKIRRKYFSWFDQNEKVCRIRSNEKNKYTTEAQLNTYKNKGWQLVERVKYDLMHLTLTVPHTENGWRGNKIYFSEIMNAFNQMRKTTEWNRQVYGGEFGVETTKNKSGYHIHIHALLFVAKGTQNRNRLHLDIMRIWNRLTVDKDANRTEFDEKQRTGIKKGNSKLITDEFINKLNPKGATLIGLECIYTLNDGIKTRSNEWGSEAMIKGVLETISYHFKPKIFNVGESSHDVKTIVDMLPKVYKKVLYRKFGCLHGEKSLNVNDDSLLEDYNETAEYVDEETGEVLETQFFITNPIHVYPKGKEDEIALMQKARVEVLRVHSGKEAVKQMIEKSYKNN